jgi:hypothetical protein
MSAVLRRIIGRSAELAAEKVDLRLPHLRLVAAGLSILSRIASVPWEDIRSWRRRGDRFSLDFKRWRTGLRWDDRYDPEVDVEFQVQAEAADELEALLREHVVAPTGS